MFMESLNIGDLVQVIYSPGLLDREAGIMRYIGMVGIIVGSGSEADCWVIQFDDDSEVEIPVACLEKG
jgi:hypothetical protein